MSGRAAVSSVAGAFLVYISSAFGIDRLVPSEYDTIQAAINASSNGDRVIIAPGTYTGTGNKNLDFGGRAITVTSEDPNDWAVVGATIINCENSGRGFYFHNGEASDSIVAGLTITNGSGNLGAGICCDSASPAITKCVFSSNTASRCGGGFFSQSASPTVTNCIFTGNSADFFGGGVANFYCSNVSIRNCIFASNTSDLGGGIENENSTGQIANCTFSGNSADCGGALEVYGAGGPTVVNCIFWGDSAPEGPEIYGSCVVSYSDIQGGYAGTGNIDADPCFINPSGGDYHLLEDSLCIDAGDPAYSPPSGEVGIDGEPRIMNLLVDMGADEFCIDSPFNECGAWGYHPGDINKDCEVNFADIAMLASDWCVCTWPNELGCENRQP